MSAGRYRRSSGLLQLLEALEDTEHPDHEELTDWYGGPFDPNDLDEAGIRKRLARLVSSKKRKAS